MVDASTNKATSPTAAAEPRTAAAAADNAAPPLRPVGNGARHHVGTASFDEMLAKEVLASFRRTQAMARAEPAKPKPRRPVPPATLVVRPPKSYPWTMPFVSLASYVGLSTLLCAGGLAYLFVQPATTTTARPPAAELRGLRDSVEQLRHSIAALSNDVAANRSALAAANQTFSDRIVRLAARFDRADQPVAARKLEPAAQEATQSAYAEPGDPPGEITGTIQRPRPPAAAEPAVVAGWRVRRAYDGAAVLEGPSGVIEVSLGQDVPALGRIQDITSANGRLQVTTSKGLIVSR
ncbi:MAG TPA: hypothetical protein VGC77_20740 [Rhodopseudomonas sp.]|uniref:hypothetical protein n=1 Tax=Rhodopseudomonas sp. TaxID=1078 RepID=UPI002EDA2A82